MDLNKKSEIILKKLKENKFYEVISECKKLIKNISLISFYLILFLIFFQGFIGWHMVKSGLTERTDVSHYRLLYI